MTSFLGSVRGSDLTCVPSFQGGLICVLATVQADWWKMGQLAAGDTFRFIQPTQQAAAEQLQRQKQWLASVESAVKTGSPASAFPHDVSTEPQVVTDGVIKVIAGDEALDAPSLTFKLVSLLFRTTHTKRNFLLLMLLLGVQSGDGGILIEIGDQNLYFRTRLIAELWERRLRSLAKKGELPIHRQRADAQHSEPLP